MYVKVKSPKGTKPNGSNRITGGGVVDHILSERRTKPSSKEVVTVSDYEMLMVMLSFTSIIVVVMIEYIKK